jgi:hypothetical protein
MKNGNTGAGIYCKLLSFHLSLGQYTTHFDGETKAVNTALLQLFSRIRSFEKAVIFSDSILVIQSIATFDALPSKKVTKTHSHIKVVEKALKML